MTVMMSILTHPSLLPLSLRILFHLPSPISYLLSPISYLLPLQFSSRNVVFGYSKCSHGYHPFDSVYCDYDEYTNTTSILHSIQPYLLHLPSPSLSFTTPLLQSMFQVPDTYDIAVIITGDKDFIPALQKVRLKGRRTAIMSMKNSCNRELTRNDIFIKGMTVMMMMVMMVVIMVMMSILTSASAIPASCSFYSYTPHFLSPSPSFLYLTIPLIDFENIWLEEYIDDIVEARARPGSGAMPSALSAYISDFLVKYIKEQCHGSVISSRDVGRLLAASYIDTSLKETIDAPLSSYSKNMLQVCDTLLSYFMYLSLPSCCSFYLDIPHFFHLPSSISFLPSFLISPYIIILTIL